jgi:ElaB/YqjD/DUF883 family membrane-anchored ribosome-binding protein
MAGCTARRWRRVRRGVNRLPVAGDKVGEARKRLAAALDRAKEIAGRVRDKAVEGAKAADQAVRDKPYQAIGIAFAVGAVVGYFVMRRCSRNGD